MTLDDSRESERVPLVNALASVVAGAAAATAAAKSVICDEVCVWLAAA